MKTEGETIDLGVRGGGIGGSVGGGGGGRGAASRARAEGVECSGNAKRLKFGTRTEKRQRISYQFGRTFELQKACRVRRLLLSKHEKLDSGRKEGAWDP